MFFCELPVGAKFRFNGVTLTKTSMGGNCVTETGAHDWMASHNVVQPIEGQSEIQVQSPAPKPQATSLSSILKDLRSPPTNRTT